MYVWACMFENPLPVMENETYTLKHKPPIVYVCMSQAAKRVCMYVCLKHPYIHSHVSNTHTYTLRFLCKIKLSACMDLYKNTTKHKVLKHTYMFKLHRISCFRKLLSMYVCLKCFCFIVENAQPKLSKHIVSCFSLEHVCMFEKVVQYHLFCRAFCTLDTTVHSQGHRFFKTSKRYEGFTHTNMLMETPLRWAYM